MTRKQYATRLEEALGDRRLVFLSMRGADAETLLELQQLHTVIAEVSPLGSSRVNEFCMENLTGERVDYSQRTLDHDERPQVAVLREALLEALSAPSVVLPFVPNAILTAAWFPRADTTAHLAPFHELQACLEYKPWVEQELKRHGVRTLDWEYYADSEAQLILERLHAAPDKTWVLRAGHTWGGIGVKRLTSPEELQAIWPEHTDGFVALSEYLKDSLPLNIGACLFPEGEVSFHAASFQLIGLPSATNHALGYCGNDFAAFAQLDEAVIEALAEMTLAVGTWLAKWNYLGAFGIDALVHEGTVYLSEINPRFQGSTMLAAYIDRDLDRPDLYQEHLGAYLGLPPADRRSLREITATAPPYAHLLRHNTGDQPLQRLPAAAGEPPLRHRQLPAPKVQVLPEGLTFQAIIPSQVTDSGLSLFPEIQQAFDATFHTFYES
ncbi:MAG: ATP-grasp domain-containing protein [candidate division WS1 bacterium]|nr:ATP-grasp domain-containing protein [candidate division WS1 bacterium]